MAINETEAKRICNLSGASYCDLEDALLHRYEFHFTDNGVHGFFWIENNELVKVSYTVNDLSTRDVLFDAERQFTEASEWAAFCNGLNDINPQDFVRASNSDYNLDDGVNESEFDPQLDRDFATDELREQRVRKGQDIYRKRLENVWGGACAITGITQRELLRASHAKPWADCTSGEERLNPYNGLLLNVALDALFDKNLISFDESGKIMIAPQLSLEELSVMGVLPDMRLRMLLPEHKPFLDYQRRCFEDEKLKAELEQEGSQYDE